MKNFKILFAVATMFMFSQTSFAQDEVVSKKPTKEVVTDGNAECVKLMQKVERRFENAISKRPDRFETKAAQVKLKQRIIEKLGAKYCYSNDDRGVEDQELEEDAEANNHCVDEMFKDYMANKRVGSKEELAKFRQEFMETYAQKIKEKCNQ